jgi:hypothetical protein
MATCGRGWRRDNLGRPERQERLGKPTVGVTPGPVLPNRLGAYIPGADPISRKAGGDNGKRGRGCS